MFNCNFTHTLGIFNETNISFFLFSVLKQISNYALCLNLISWMFLVTFLIIIEQLKKIEEKNCGRYTGKCLRYVKRDNSCYRQFAIWYQLVTFFWEPNLSSSSNSFFLVLAGMSCRRLLTKKNLNRPTEEL